MQLFYEKRRYLPMLSIQSLVCIPTEIRADSGTTANNIRLILNGINKMEYFKCYFVIRKENNKMLIQLYLLIYFICSFNFTFRF